MRQLEERISLLEARDKDMIEFGHTKSVFQSEAQLKEWNNDVAKLLIFMAGFSPERRFPIVYDLYRSRDLTKTDRVQRTLSKLVKSSLFGKDETGLGLVNKDLFRSGVRLPNGQFIGEEYSTNRDGTFYTARQAVITAPDKGLPYAGRAAYRDWYVQEFFGKDSKFFPADLIHEIDWWLSQGKTKVFSSSKQRTMFRSRLVEFGKALQRNKLVDVTKYNITKSRDGRWVNKVELQFDLKGIGYSFRFFVDYNGINTSYETSHEYTRRGHGEQGYRFH